MPFHSVGDIGKTNKEREAKQREKLKKDEKNYQGYLPKYQMIKKLKPLEDKRKPKPEQDAFKGAERVRVQKY